MIDGTKLYRQAKAEETRVLAIGEILWDLFDSSACLGGAPLNFTAHASRMLCETILISALGNDEWGQSARTAIGSLGINSRFISTDARYPTGTAAIRMEGHGNASFHIVRPAAYDRVELSDADIGEIAVWSPQWLYFGTLFLCTDQAQSTLGRIIEAIPTATRFYDINLRPGCYTPELVRRLLGVAQVAKLNESEMQAVGEYTGLPCATTEGFCRASTERFSWKAVCVTLGERGCGILAGGDYVETKGLPVRVADTVGAGDAFAAALVRGLSEGWPLPDIAAFANRVGALIASRPGAIPEWNLAEADEVLPV